MNRAAIIGTAVVLLMTACGTPGGRSGEPANLSAAKADVRAYVDSGAYLREIAAVARRAETWVKERAAARRAGERLAVVFDLDETLLLNYPHIERNDFGYLPAVWSAWVETAAAPAIEPVREVYRAARAAGVDVFFLTGRGEKDRAGTVRNLQTIGCGEFAELICRPDGNRATAATFKTAARARLTREGWTIVANLGDQWSDLTGGHAERTFKLPNPFYAIE